MKPKTEAPKAEQFKNRGSGRSRLSFREKRELEMLESLLTDLENEKSGLESELNSGILVQNDLMKKSERLAGLLVEIEAKTIRWIELSEKE